MVRLILFIVFILFLIWILGPILKTKGSYKDKDKIERVLGSDQRNSRPPNTLMLLTGVILFIVIIWLLPKFGINILSLIQKIIPIISSLRGVLPI